MGDAESCHTLEHLETGRSGGPKVRGCSRCCDLGVKPHSGRAFSRPNPTADLVGVEREVSDDQIPTAVHARPDIGA